MAKVYDLTQGKPSSLILKFYFPMLLTNMLQQIYTIADTIIVGKGLGDNQLGAVGNMSSLTFFIIGFSIGITNGFSILIAQFFGAKNEEKLKKSVATSISLAVLITVILTIISMTFLSPVLKLLQTDEIIMNDSLIYGYIIFGGLFTTIAYNLCASILRALGDSKTPFVAIIVSTVVNIIFNWIAVYIMHTGVEGPAIVTIASQVISAIICYIKLSKIDIIRVKKEHFRYDISMYCELLKNGIPMAIMNSITAIGCMTIQYFVNGMGVVFTSAYSACSKYINLFMQPACTSGYAMSSFTSQNYGAGRMDRIKKGLNVCLIISFISYITLGSVMVIFSEQLAGFMLNGEEQIALSKGYLIRSGSMLFAVDFLFVVRSACQGMGKPLIPMISGITEMALRVIMVVFFIGEFGFNATSYAEIVAWIGAMILNSVAIYHYLYGKQSKHTEILSVA